MDLVEKATIFSHFEIPLVSLARSYAQHQLGRKATIFSHFEIPLVSLTSSYAQHQLGRMPACHLPKGRIKTGIPSLEGKQVREYDAYER